MSKLGYGDADAVDATDGNIDAADADTLDGKHDGEVDAATLAGKSEGSLSVGNADTVDGKHDGELDAATLNGKSEDSLSVDNAANLGGTAASNYALDSDLPTIPSSTGAYSSNIGWTVEVDTSGNKSGASYSLSTEADGIYVDAVAFYNDEPTAYNPDTHDYTITLNFNGNPEFSVSNTASLGDQEGVTHNISGPVYVDEIVMSTDVPFSSIDWRVEVHQLGVISHSHSI